jgi:N-6 DNA Methylase
MRHETPLQIAALLARYAPRRTRSVLDPAAGLGVLARPFFARQTCTRVELLDVDRRVVGKLKNERLSGKSLTVSQANFLRWAEPGGRGCRKRFDCIVMNPPFAGRIEEFVCIRLHSKRLKNVSIETAFVYLAIHLLRLGGRLLAILPPSIVSGESNRWLRKYLITCGRIRLVHELPPLTFPNVEGPIYLFVFERGQSQSYLLSRNHRLLNPDQLRIDRRVVQSTARFDFRFHEAREWMKAIRQGSNVKWASLGSLVTLFRGGAKSPIVSRSILHTTNLPTFRAKRLRRLSKAATTKLAQNEDIIIKRVGRNAASSAILYKGRYPAKCSDCILILRPQSGCDVRRVLFSLRVLIAWRRGAGLVENGVGATYISSRALGSLEIPVNLPDLHPVAFGQFSNSIEKSDWASLPIIEGGVRRAIKRLSIRLKQQN